MKRTEQAQRFRVDLSDTLRNITDAPTMANTACRMLCEFLGVSRANWALAYPDEERLEVQDGWKDGQPGNAGVYSYKEFGLGLLAILSTGEWVIVSDTSTDPLTKDFYETSYAPLGIGAFMAESLVRSRNLIAIMSVHNPTAREWTLDEATLLKDVARRVWEAIERSRAEEKAKRMTERYRALAETAASIVFVASPDGHFTELPFLKGIWIEGENVRVPDGWLQMIHEDDQLSARAAWTRALETQNPFEANFRVRTIRGNYRWHWARAARVLDENGGLVEWVGSCIDVHDRMVQDRTLEVLNDFTSKAQQLETPEEIIACAQELLRERLSASNVTYFESSSDSRSPGVAGLEQELHAGEQDEGNSSWWPSDLELEDVEEGGTFGVSPRDTASPLKATIRVPLWSDSRLLAVLEVHHLRPRSWSSDEVQLASAVLKRCWSESRRARAQQELLLSEKRLRQLNAELDTRVQQRTADLSIKNEEMENFTYCVAHDLRAPLRSIVSTSQMLLAECAALEPSHRQLLERQTYNSMNLANLIDQLLRLSRLGSQKLVKKQVDLTRLARTIVGEILETEARTQCVFEVEEGLSAMGDESLIRVALWNLLENAFKFSPEGGVVRLGRALVQDEVAYFVQDHGVGFDMIYVDKLFRPFERLVVESEFPGTGIGLSSVKRIVQRHGGRVWVESVPTKGSTFYFTLGTSS